MKHALLAVLVGRLSLTVVSGATTEPQLLPPTVADMTFSEYLKAVAESNLGYVSQSYNVPIAQAQLAIARVFMPNPQAQLDYTWDATRGRPGDQRESAVTAGGLIQTIELGGKRHDRIDAARHNLLGASATMDDFLRNLRSSAATAFVTARADELTAARMKQTMDSFDRVVVATDKRYRAGDVGEVDATQARVDALQFHAQYLAAEASAQAAIIGLSEWLGIDRANTTIRPVANLEIPVREFDLNQLMATAMTKRPDVIAAREAHEAAQASVRLAKAGRIPDPSLGLTYTQIGASNNPTAPYARTDTLGLGLTFELPVFHQHQEEVEVARYGEKQADRAFDAAVLKAQVDVRQAYAGYRLAADQIGLYQGTGALRDAEAVLKARTFSYEHGQAGLFDLLQSQRDLNQVYSNYYAALMNYALARITLEESAGIWEVGF